MRRVPAEGHLSQLLKAVAIAKPQRERWLLEELYDLLIPLDEDARVERSGFRDVLLVLSSRLRPHEISNAAQQLEFSFMSRLVPSTSIVRAGRREELFESLEPLLPSGRKLKLIVSLRGRGKEVVAEGELEALVRFRGNLLSRQSQEVLVVESLGEVFVISFGITRRCGLSCTVVVPKEPTAF
ncbi:MAG: hypothetical protein ABDH61_02800 [Acidilobaceae archaeon]